MVIEPPLIAVLPAASVVRLVSAVALPTGPPKAVVPAVFTVSACAPFTLEPKVTLPAPVLVSVVLAPRITASA